MAIAQISLSNTFSQWLSSSISVISALNNLEEGNYTKTANTLFLNSSGTGLSVANNAVFGGVVNFNGTGTSIIVNNDVLIGGNVSINKVLTIANNRALTTNDINSSIATSANLNLSFVTANNAYAAANNAYAAANIAYAAAYSNYIVLFSAYNTANLAFEKANSGSSIVWNQANLAFEKANTGVSIAIKAYDTANLAIEQANSEIYIVLDKTNKAYNTANLAYEKANTGSSAININDDNIIDTNRYLLWSNTSSGNVSTVGTSSDELYFNPSTGTLYSTIFSSLSDATLKNNIESLSNCVDIINKLNPVQFYWNKNNKKDYGVIAQEIEKIIPSVVTDSESGIKAVEYQALIAFLIGSIKELNTRLEKLENK